MLQAFRIVHRKWAETAFSGEGARLHGGRWNSPGISLVYLASSRSLAALEMLVHSNPSILRMKYVLIEISFEADLIEKIKSKSLVPNWQAHPAPKGTTLMGDEWFEEKKSAILSVPSAIIPEEQNYLLNPLHPDFKNISIKKPQNFSFDTRLLI